MKCFSDSLSKELDLLESNEDIHYIKEEPKKEESKLVLPNISNTNN